MGFNKLFLGEKALKYRYENGGVVSVLEYLSKYDAIISTDEFSTNLIELIDVLQHGEYPTPTKEQFIETVDELFSTTNK